MKKLQSTTERTWIELKEIELTEEQKVLLKSREESDAESIKNLIAEIKSLREIPAQENDVLLANAKYDLVKPKLKEGDVYELISMDLIINEDKSSGILNCRVNNKHKQIRF